MRRLLGLVCAALIILSACGREPTPIEPKPKTSPSGAAPSASTSPAETLPEPPPYVDEASVRGRATFAGYWIHLLNYSVTTGTTNHLEAVSSPACDGCANYITQIRKDRQEGVRSIDFQWKPVTADPGAGNDVLVHVDARAYERTSKNGDPVRVDADRYEVGFELERDGSSWRARELYLPK